MNIKPLAGLKDLPSDLELVDDVSTFRLRFGVSRNGFSIFEPRLSTCGRFTVSPSSHGLTDKEADAIVELNQCVAELIDAALNNTARVLQDLLGVTTGDVAGEYFSGVTGDEYANLLTRYVMLEIACLRADWARAAK